MKYETPEMTTLTPAINAIQTMPGYAKGTFTNLDVSTPQPEARNENDIPGYKDWE